MTFFKVVFRVLEALNFLGIFAGFFSLFMNPIFGLLGIGVSICCFYSCKELAESDNWSGITWFLAPVALIALTISLIGVFEFTSATSQAASAGAGLQTGISGVVYILALLGAGVSEHANPN